MISTTSNLSAHPLRQTSFPPELVAEPHNYSPSRSPSVDTMSLVSGSVAGIKKKRGRKLKSKDKENDDASLLGVRGKSHVSKREQSRDHTVEEEEEDGGEEMAVNMAKTSKEEKAQEEQRRHMLTRAFDEDQWMRYEAWRSSKLSDAVVRRIVNQTLSQSVPAAVILAVKSATKVFAGDLIEEARKVQSQWIKATQDSQTGLPSPPNEGYNPEEKRRGPLLPDHLREAFRRHMLEGAGGLVGELGLWQQQQCSGVERFGTKLGGKRLMK